jgi:hypothetical protein
MKRIFLPMFKLDRLKEPEKLAERVQFLLEGDRFLCPEENYEVYLTADIALVKANATPRIINVAF